MGNKSYLIILCILLISASIIEGSRTHHSRRCMCMKTIKMPKMKNIGEIKLYPISAACERIEVVATMKDGKTTNCISPDAKQIKDIISGKKKKIKGIKVTNYITNRE